MRSGLPDSDMSAGQSSRATNGAGPVRILRPGDPGFPRSEDAPGKPRVLCQHPGCVTYFEPSARQRKYCTTHGTKQAEQDRWRLKLKAVDVRPAAQNSSARRVVEGAGGGNKPAAGKTRRCFQCGKDYTPTGNAQRTCQTCKSKAIAPTPPREAPTATRTAPAVVERQPETTAPASAPVPQFLTVQVAFDTAHVISLLRQAADLLERMEGQR